MLMFGYPFLLPLFIHYRTPAYRMALSVFRVHLLASVNLDRPLQACQKTCLFGDFRCCQVEHRFCSSHLGRIWSQDRKEGWNQRTFEDAGVRQQPQASERWT